MSQLYCPDGKVCQSTGCSPQQQRCRHDLTYSALRFSDTHTLATEIESLRQQLEESQAREVKFREVLEEARIVISAHTSGAGYKLLSRIDLVLTVAPANQCPNCNPTGLLLKL